MKRRMFPLFWKFTIAIVAIVFVFGTINVIVIWSHVRSSIEAELFHHASFIARSSASQAEVPLLHDDVVTLQRIIDDMVAIDSSIAYAFIEDGHGRVLAHSFEFGVPEALRTATPILHDSDITLMHIVPSTPKARIILDVAVPVMDRNVGLLRVGFHEDAISQSANVLLQWLLLMIGLFLIAGILGAFVFARVITRPIQAVVDVANTIAHSAAETVALPRVTVPDRYKIGRVLQQQVPDELDELVLHLNEMIIRLESTMMQLRRTQASLLQSEKLAAIGTLAAGVAHEINNPLAGLRNCIKRIQRNPGDVERNAQYLSLIVTAADQIKHVVDGLLDFTRRQDFELKVTDIKELAGSVIDLVSYRMEAAKIILEYDAPTELTPIRCSPNHIKQVLLNLLINGIDAILLKREKGAKADTLRMRLSQRADMLHVEIHDDGVGIEPRHLDSVFDPFFTTKDVGKGTGLGLAVSYHLIKDHGGEIWVESEVGECTTFTVALPLHIEDKQL